MSAFLIDTHIYIWADSEPCRLSPQVRAILDNPNHHIYLSMASLWELQIKMQLGKLTLNTPLAQAIEHIKANNLYIILPIKERDILGLQRLPFHHKDPFDRLLISQAIHHDLTLITLDEHIVKYDVKCIF
ncbi:type II toxin-antitoxin system VapC family toxin [Moraxella sp. K127]|uniref:type II toxin-antitoxin system VapC family toxin n=1 Tax=Moraxella sp. K127 TaxID=2780079 RepID=UPI0018809499|nr:type II toxin-antitoxin system VapC family toxin [Moraxella sp. K127]MBE9590572.1 type II toxin-antitoxin system VapC family toxin [Moraxella sp. K127]